MKTRLTPVLIMLASLFVAPMISLAQKPPEKIIWINPESGNRITLTHGWFYDYNFVDKNENRIRFSGPSAQIDYYRSPMSNVDVPLQDDINDDIKRWASIENNIDLEWQEHFSTPYHFLIARTRNTIFIQDTYFRRQRLIKISCQKSEDCENTVELAVKILESLRPLVEFSSVKNFITGTSGDWDDDWQLSYIRINKAIMGWGIYSPKKNIISALVARRERHINPTDLKDFMRFFGHENMYPYLEIIPKSSTGVGPQSKAARFDAKNQYLEVFSLEHNYVGYAVIISPPNTKKEDLDMPYRWTYSMLNDELKFLGNKEAPVTTLKSPISHFAFDLPKGWEVSPPVFEDPNKGTYDRMLFKGMNRITYSARWMPAEYALEWPQKFARDNPALIVKEYKDKDMIFLRSTENRETTSKIPYVSAQYVTYKRGRLWQISTVILAQGDSKDHDLIIDKMMDMIRADCAFDINDNETSRH